MRHLGMKLQTIVVARFIRHSGQRRIVGGTDHTEPRRQLVNPVTMAHPDIQQAPALRAGGVLDIAQQARMPACPDLGVAVLVFVRVGHAAAELRGHGLHAIADTKHRNTRVKHALWRLRRGFPGDRFRPARQYDAARLLCLQGLLAIVVGPDLAIHAGLAHTSRDQLRVLRTEIDDQDAMRMDICAHVLVSRIDPGRTNGPGPASGLHGASPSVR